MGIAVGYGRVDVFGDSVGRLAGIDPLWLAQAVSRARMGSLLTHCDDCFAPIYEGSGFVTDEYPDGDALTFCERCAERSLADRKAMW